MDAEEVPSEAPAGEADASLAPAEDSPAADAPAVKEYPLITEISLPPAPAEPRRTQEQTQQPAETPFAAPAAGTGDTLSDLSPGAVEGLSSPEPSLALASEAESSPGKGALSPGVPESQASEALLSEQGSAALVSAQDSTASSATTARRRKDKTYRQVGTELVELRTLTKSELEASAERLSAPKAIVEASTVRPKALQLKYKFDKSLRGGKGGYTEVLVPAKKTAAADKQEFMVKLAERCKEQKEKTLEKLKEKYLGPLNPNAKKVHKGDEQTEHLAKLDRLYHGQGVVEGKAG